ncbi:hypothetical protein O181_087639 [Austropuccinia psidii MF-1]|uniref:Uncharacterized protein n=1 Tax=Austropuccinia psidii MF-1 TaxID=1389203 RepID=A0A9Q3P206_9BASI|nr:hypothetical protein [Austropuccinia psidii MF-1]
MSTCDEQVGPVIVCPDNGTGMNPLFVYDQNNKSSNYDPLTLTCITPASVLWLGRALQQGASKGYTRTPLSFCLRRAFPFSVAALAATELQFFPHALKLRLLRVLQLLTTSQLHHGIKDHLQLTSPSLSFSPAPLCSSSPAAVLLGVFPLVFLPFHSTKPTPLPFSFSYFQNPTSIHLVHYLHIKLLSTLCSNLITNLNCFFFRCHALYAPSGVSPAFVPRQRPTLVMLSDKHTRNVHLLSAPSNHKAIGVLAQDALARTPLWSMMMKPYPSVNGHRDPKQANGNGSGQLALSPKVLICPPPLLGHHPMIASLPDRSEVIIRPMKDGDGERTFELGPIITMSCHQWDSNAKQTPRQPTPGVSGTQWSEELFHEPSQTKEPPIPGPSPSSQPPEDVPTHEPEPEVAPKQFTEEPFGKSPLLFLHSYQLFLTFSLTTSSLSCHSPLNHYHRKYAHWIPLSPPPSSLPTPPPSHPVPPSPVQSPSHSHDHA